MGWSCGAAPETTLDVGADIGVFSLYLKSKAPGIRVLAFEPSARTFGQLQANLAENKAEGEVTARRLAVGREVGVLHLSVAGVDSAGHQAVVEGGTGDAVESLGLADVLALAGDGPIDLLKVDTEGAEVDIIAFAPPEVWPRIARVVVEYHDLGKRDAVLSTLQANGYRCTVVPARGYEDHLGLIYALRG